MNSTVFVFFYTLEQIYNKTLYLCYIHRLRGTDRFGDHLGFRHSAFWLGCPLFLMKRTVLLFNYSSYVLWFNSVDAYTLYVCHGTRIFLLIVCERNIFLAELYRLIVGLISSWHWWWTPGHKFTNLKSNTSACGHRCGNIATGSYSWTCVVLNAGTLFSLCDLQ